MSLILAFRKQRQADLCESEASLVYRVSSRTGSKTTQRNPVSKQNKQTKKEKRKGLGKTHTTQLAALHSGEQEFWTGKTGK